MSKTSSGFKNAITPLRLRWSRYTRNERTAIMSLALLVVALAYLPISIFLS